MLICELNFVVQSIASIVWRNAKQKRENSGLNFVKNIDKSSIRFEMQRGRGEKELFVTE